MASDALFFSDGASDVGAQLPLGYADVLVRAMLGLVSVVQIARSGTVRAPWNWAPTWGFAALAVTFLLIQLAVFDVRQDATLLATVLALDGLVRAGSAVFLGVLAIVLANRGMAPRTVPVFRSSDATD